jgi:hypothetical protein
MLQFHINPPLHRFRIWDSVAEQHVECGKALSWLGYCTFGKERRCLASQRNQTQAVAYSEQWEFLHSNEESLQGTEQGRGKGNTSFRLVQKLSYVSLSLSPSMPLCFFLPWSFCNKTERNELRHKIYNSSAAYNVYGSAEVFLYFDFDTGCADETRSLWP